MKILQQHGTHIRWKAALLALSCLSCMAPIADAKSAELANQPFVPHSMSPLNRPVIDTTIVTTPTFPIPSDSERRRLLVIGWDPARPGQPAPSIADVHAKTFGGSGSVQHYFSVNSGGKFTVSEVAVLGWYGADK